MVLDRPSPKYLLTKYVTGLSRKDGDAALYGGYRQRRVNEPIEVAAAHRLQLAQHERFRPTASAHPFIEQFIQQILLQERKLVALQQCFSILSLDSGGILRKTDIGPSVRFIRRLIRCAMTEVTLGNTTKDEPAFPDQGMTNVASFQLKPALCEKQRLF